MIDVERQHFRKELMRFLYITQSAITQSHYIATVNAIALVEIIVPNGQIGQRNSKVVYATMVEEVFLTMLDELIETASSFVLLTQFTPSQSLEVNLIGLLVVVEEGLLRLIATNGSNCKATFGLLDITQPFMGKALIIPHIVLLGILQLTFSQIVRILLCLGQQG